MIEAHPGPTGRRQLWVDPGAPKERLSLSPYSAYPLSLLWMESVLVCSGSCAKTLFHPGKCTYDRPQSPKEIPHPSFRVLPPEPRFARVLGQCEWFWTNFCRQMLMLDEELKNVLNFLSFLFYFCNLYCTPWKSLFWTCIFINRVTNDYLEFALG